MEGERDGERADDVKIGGCAVTDADKNGVEDDASFQRVGHYDCLGLGMFLVKVIRRLPIHNNICWL